MVSIYFGKQMHCYNEDNNNCSSYVYKYSLKIYVEQAKYKSRGNVKT